MPQLRSHCVLCCEIIYGAGLKAKDLTDWHKDCVSSFCETLKLNPSSLSKTRFCVKCQQLLRDMNFLVRNIEKFQKKLRVLTTRAKAILLMNAKQLENEAQLYSITVRTIVSSLGQGQWKSADIQTFMNPSSDSDAKLQAGLSVQGSTSSSSASIHDHGSADDDKVVGARRKGKRKCVQ